MNRKQAGLHIDSEMTIKVAQINTNRSIKSANTIVEILERRKFDLALIQEPYIIKNKVAGFPTRYRTYTSGDERKRTAIVVRNPKLDVILITQLSSEDIVVVEVSCNNHIIIFASVYADITQDIDVILHKIDQVRQSYGLSTKIIICIDSNARSQTWFDTSTNERGRRLEAFLYSTGYYLANKDSPGFTFESSRGKSNIDLTIISSSTLPVLMDWKLSNEESGSDHQLIEFKVHLGTPKTNSRKTTVQRTKFITSKNNLEKFNNSLKSNLLKLLPAGKSSISLDETLSGLVAGTGIQAVDKFYNAILRSCSESLPKSNNRYRSFPGRSVPWWNNDLTEMRKRVVRFRKIYQKTGQGLDTLRHERKQTYLREKYIYQKTIQKSKRESWKEVTNLVNKENPWNFIYKSAVKKLKKPALLSTIAAETGKYTTDLQTTLTEILDTFVASDNTSTDSNDHSVLRGEWTEPLVTTDDVLFTSAEIKDAIHKFDSKKTPGRDGINSEVLRRVFDQFPKYFTSVYNLCLSNGYFPDEWKVSLIIPLVKPGKEDCKQASKYRPISLINLNGKLLEQLLINRIQYFLYKNNALSRSQFGFTPQTSTTAAIMEVHNFVQSNFRQKNLIGLISLDVKGAFDSAWWPSIIHQLRVMKCPQNLFNLTKNYFQNRKAILATNHYSVEKIISKGCPQGSCSSPGFWNIMFDSLLKINFSPETKVIAFADDVLLLVPGNTGKSVEVLANLELMKVSRWANQNKIIFNPDKSEYIIISRKRRVEDTNIFLSHREIRRVQVMKYLGVHFDSKWEFKPHIEKIIQKCKTLILELSKSAKINWGLKTSVMRTIYEGAIVPLISYAAPVWVEALNKRVNKTKINSMQRLMLIKIVKAYHTISHEASCVLSGLPPLDLKIKELAAIQGLVKGFKTINDVLGEAYEEIQVDMPTPFWKAIHPALFQDIHNSVSLEQEDLNAIKNDLIIYTDGSKLENQVGCGLVGFIGGSSIFKEGYRLAEHCSNNQAEALAILQSLLWLKNTNSPQVPTNVIIATDSQVTLLSIKNRRNHNSQIELIREVFIDLSKKGKKIRFTWVKGHNDIHGNEIADNIAKESAQDNLLPIVYSKMPISFIKKHIQRQTNEKWENAWSETRNGAQTKKFFPKIEDRLKIKNMELNGNRTALLSNHGRLRAYLHRFKIINSGRCPCDTEDQTADHLIHRCPTIENLRSKLMRTCAGTLDLPLNPLTLITKYRHAFFKFADSINLQNL